MAKWIAKAVRRRCAAVDGWIVNEVVGVSSCKMGWMNVVVEDGNNGLSDSGSFRNQVGDWVANQAANANSDVW